MAGARSIARGAKERAGYGLPRSLPVITVEMAGYGVLILAGLALRLSMLGAWPLLESELPSALAAWRATSSMPWATVSGKARRGSVQYSTYRVLPKSLLATTAR